MDFSCDLTITVGGISYTAEYLSGITISKSIDGIGTSGISTSELSGSIYTSSRFSQGAEVTISYNGWSFPTYYLETSEFNGTVVTFTAYDSCKTLDIPFDYSGYEATQTKYKSENGETVSYEVAATYAVSLIVGNIASQCGFSGSSISSNISTLKYSELCDKTCREILQKLSEADLGLYYCDNSDILKFQSFTTSQSGTSTTTSTCSGVVERSQRTVSKLIIENTTDSEIYEFGSGGYANALMLSGDYCTEDVATAIASTMFASGGSYTISAFTIDKAIIGGNIEVFGTVIIYDTEGNMLSSWKCGTVVINFALTGAYATLSQAMVYESQAEYMSLLDRKLKATVKQGTSYGNYFLNKNGSGVAVKL